MDHAEHADHGPADDRRRQRAEGVPRRALPLRFPRRRSGLEPSYQHAVPERSGLASRRTVHQEVAGRTVIRGLMAAEHGDHQNSTAGIMFEDISKLAPAMNFHALLSTRSGVESRI